VTAPRCKRCRDGVPHDIPHGTSNGYDHHSCRCDPCRAAKNAKDREYRDSGRNAAACRAWRERRRRKEPSATGEGIRCARCGIDHQRCRRVRGTALCVDCHEVERWAV
jgi:hypothetical protein